MKYSKEYRRILLTGATGQVGWELSRTLAPFGEVIAPGRDKFDLARPESLREKVREWKPDLIVNPAAYTAVDQAETEYEMAFKINADSPKVLAEESARLNIPFIHYSTDYVFDGEKKGAYCEDDEPNPLNVYGESKLQGDEAVCAAVEENMILRLSWIYGRHGKNFFTTMHHLFKEQEEVFVVNDQFGAPTWSRMIAEMTADIITVMDSSNRKDNYWGLYHVASAGRVSWFEFANRIHGMVGNKKSILHPISTEQYGAPATRPMNSQLNSSMIKNKLGIYLPDWSDQLKQIITHE